MKIERIWAMPNKHTFLIGPIAALVHKYVDDGKGWIDPFAGENSPAEFTNDLNPKKPTQYHMLAEDFCKKMEGPFEGILFDPPYSYRQIKECYEGIGLPVKQEDTQSRFYNKVKNAATNKIKTGGYALSFGWDTNGFGKNRGFKIVEILLVAHGGHHHDTLCTVEEKVQSQMF